MDATLEVRWFNQGDVPDAVASWFSSLEPNKTSVREDVYVHPSDPAVNVKLRGGKGRVEIKRRIGSEGRMQFHPAVVGPSEHWRRFKFPIGAEPPFLSDEGRLTGCWRSVQKERRQRVYSPEEQKALLPASERLDRPAEAKIELTEVTLEEGAPWWTICVEAEGRPEALLDTLRPMGRHMFSLGDPPALGREQAFGYAQWLMQAGVSVPTSDGRRVENLAAD